MGKIDMPSIGDPGEDETKRLEAELEAKIKEQLEASSKDIEIMPENSPIIETRASTKSIDEEETEKILEEIDVAKQERISKLQDAISASGKSVVEKDKGRAKMVEEMANTIKRVSPLEKAQLSDKEIEKGEKDATKFTAGEAARRAGVEKLAKNMRIVSADEKAVEAAKKSDKDIAKRLGLGPNATSADIDAYFEKKAKEKADEDRVDRIQKLNKKLGESEIEEARSKNEILEKNIAPISKASQEIGEDFIVEKSSEKRNKEIAEMPQKIRQEEFLQKAEQMQAAAIEAGKKEDKKDAREGKRIIKNFRAADVVAEKTKAERKINEQLESDKAVEDATKTMEESIVRQFKEDAEVYDAVKDFSDPESEENEKIIKDTITEDILARTSKASQEIGEDFTTKRPKSKKDLLKDYIAPISKSSQEIGEDFTINKSSKKRNKEVAEIAERIRRSTPSEIRKYDEELVRKARISEEELARKMRTPAEEAQKGIDYWKNELINAKTETDRITARKFWGIEEAKLAKLTGGQAPTGAPGGPTGSRTGGPEGAPAARPDGAEGGPAAPRSPEVRGADAASAQNRTSSTPASRQEAAPSPVSTARTVEGRAPTGYPSSISIEGTNDWFKYLEAELKKRMEGLRLIENKSGSKKGKRKLGNEYFKEMRRRFKEEIKLLKKQKKNLKGNDSEQQLVINEIKQKRYGFRIFTDNARKEGLVGYWRFIGNWFNPTNWIPRNLEIPVSQTGIPPAAEAAPKAAPNPPVGGPAVETPPAQPNPEPTPPVPPRTIR